MEDLNDEASLEPFRDVTQRHIFNKEEDGQVLDDNSVGKEHTEIFSDLSKGIDKEHYKSLDEVVIPSTEMSSKTIVHEDIPSNKNEKNENFTLAIEQDSGVFEDILRQDCEIVDGESTSVKEQNNLMDTDAIFPMLNKDNNTTVDELAFHRDILEEDSSNEKSSQHCKSETATDAILLEPLSPVKDSDVSDEELDVQEAEREYRSTRSDLSLPYFQLPKPDLDEFLSETEKNLEISLESHENKTSSEHSSLPCKPKPKNIVTLKPPPGVKGGFFDPKKTFITLDLSPDSPKVGPSNRKTSVPESSQEGPGGSFNNEYEKVLSSFKVDESKTPGIKRLALKEFLKKKIDQKKYEAFNQSKLLNLEDEEMEGEFNEKDVGSPVFCDEDSSDEYEEATVSFEKNNQELDEGSEPEDESAAAKETEDFQLHDDSSGNESDEDFIGVRKMKKKFLVLEEDSCDSEDLNEKKNGYDSLGSESSTLNELKGTETTENELDGKSHNKVNLNNPEICTIDKEMSKNGESAFGIFHPSEKHSIFSQISSSMPSYQPGGGFLNQNLRQEDSSDSVTSTPSQQNILDNTNDENEDLYGNLQMEQKCLRSSKSPVLENETGLENASFAHNDDSGTFGIKLDDLPVSQSADDSDIFLTEDLADVCSGAFNKKDPVSEKNLERDLKYASDEKVTDFFDDEAELSGEDDGVDEKDDLEDEEDNLDFYASDDENLPGAEVLREEIADLHMKRIMDEDAERIKEIQEQFLDDGELDGAGRSRRFAWINNDADIAPTGNNSDSDSDADAIDDSLTLNQEKTKWRHENKEDEDEDLTQELNSSGYRRRSLLKVDIIGKLKFCNEEDSPRRLSCKRPRGSYLNLDNNSASQVLKKLKASEDNFGGSRTTKHFVFRNDIPGASLQPKEVSRKSVSKDPLNMNESPKIKSVFSKI